MYVDLNHPVLDHPHQKKERKGLQFVDPLVCGSRSEPDVQLPHHLNIIEMSL